MCFGLTFFTMKESPTSPSAREAYVRAPFPSDVHAASVQAWDQSTPIGDNRLDIRIAHGLQDADC